MLDLTKRSCSAILRGVDALRLAVGELLHKQWKDLEDSYKKYKKQTEELSEGMSRYHKWCWTENIQLLESCGYKRNNSPRVRINSASLHDCSLDSELPVAIQLVSTTSIPTNPPLRAEIVYLESLEALSKDSPTSTIAVMEPTRLSEPSFNWRSSSAKRSYCKSADDGDRIHFKRSKTVEPSQAIDLLFQSYAETFKSFSTKNQVFLKVKLAKLFADAELSEINEPSAVCSSASGVTDEHDCTFDSVVDLDTMKHTADSDISSID